MGRTTVACSPVKTANITFLLSPRLSLDEELASVDGSPIFVGRESRQGVFSVTPR